MKKKYGYYVWSKDNGKLVCSGSSSYCADYLGCERSTVINLSKKVVRGLGFFNSRYRVTREPYSEWKKKALRDALLKMQQNRQEDSE